MKNIIKAIVFVFVVSLLTLFLATQYANTEREPYVDPEISLLVEEWKDLMDRNEIRYEAGFKRIDYIILANSNIHSGTSDKTNRTIYLNIRDVRSGPYTARSILYHELGHYVFNLKHCDEKSIMYSECLSEEHYKFLIEIYLNKCKIKEHEGRF